ncbi:endonuclease [Rhodobacter sp. KR11]|uniref:endonuclease/exonuclease/phosphatase family protein n=1 Tax=Rhodobacter sp. KR11 TaxID=2974588 RepID=UPI0022234472|nr:endonuclease/exonuclease/phosphatase family protein [Rhodobacter sp. KR11]MCW1920501.1 endonuclease [Rhodobacter sp. KR11]
MKFATWNVAWMNALFDDQGAMLPDDQPSSRYGVTRGEQLAAIGIVLTALDADGIMLIEAPDQSARRSTLRALEGLAAHVGLRARRAVVGFASDTEQEIAFLYDPDVMAARHDPQGAPALAQGGSLAQAPRFDTGLRHDADGDGAAELIRFSKPPLELAVDTATRHLRLIGVHAKSKAPHGANGAEEARRISITNRRKQLAECTWVRARVEAHLAAGDSLMVMGDFNDGPGLDKYERLFGVSGVELVMGLSLPRPRRLFDPHAFLAINQRGGLTPTTARFWNPVHKCYFEALLDYVMVSHDLFTDAARWRIWHPFNDPGVAGVADLSAAVLAASDHFPVTVDL